MPTKKIEKKFVLVVEIRYILVSQVSDLKLLLLINGLQTATSTFTCPYFLVTQNNIKTDLSMQNYKSYDLRTYGNIKNLYEKFKVIYDKEKKFAKECGNVVNKPLFCEYSAMYVTEKCVVSKLHLMHSMDKIVQNCFSIRQPNIIQLRFDTSLLRKAILSTGVSQTLKLHIILNHIEDSLQFLDDDGLGTWSEQAGEAIHHEFLKYWNKNKINLIQNDRYAINLTKQW